MDSFGGSLVRPGPAPSPRTLPRGAPDTLEQTCLDIFGEFLTNPTHHDQIPLMSKRTAKFLDIRTNMSRHDWLLLLGVAS